VVSKRALLLTVITEIPTLLTILHLEIAKTLGFIDKDNMIISYLTLNIISIKTVSSIAVSLTLGDFFTPYTTLRPILYHHPSIQLITPVLVSSFLYTILFYVSYVCLCVVFIIHRTLCDSYLFLVTVLLTFCCFMWLSYSCMDCLLSVYARPYVLCNFYSCNGVRMSHWIKGYLTWLDLTKIT